MPEFRFITPQEWYESLDVETRKIADQKIDILKRFNADDPLGWVSSEMREDIPQVARFLFLHRVRSEVINGHISFSIPENPEFERSIPPFERMKVGEEAFDRLIESGVNREDLVRVARAAVCSAAFNFVEMLDSGTFQDEFEELRSVASWDIMEVTEIGDERKPTGRLLDGLHESIFSLYPEDE